uniref:alpha/beta hydrolase family protein n=1 Tax=Sphingomonas bacterium TaxID=1895847 RepID=UPI00260FCAA5|nr:prolyl oligopeptidase family serine peptidase [Sphingomonas bacterium]
MMRKRFVAGTVGLVLALAAMPALAQKDGKLDASIDTESKDVQTRLEALQQDQYATQQLLYAVLFNQTYGEQVTMRQVLYPNHDGDITPAYVFTARGQASGKRQPGLVIVHGSYHGNLDPNMFGLINAAAMKGYVVIFPEYRGSRGYGKALYDAIDFGGKEVDDVAAAAEYLVHRYPEVDPKRMAIYGRSKGGMITLLAIERFPRLFAAAVDNVGLTDMVAYMAYKPAFRGDDLAKQPRFGGKTPAQDLAPYIDVSPINHVDQIETPLLIQSTTGDRTAPVALHAGRLIDVMKARGKVFESKIYDLAPGGHLFAQADTDQAHEAQDATFSFLDKYLGR